MKIESEKLLERKLRDKVKAAGGWSVKWSSSFITGLPDRILLFPGGRLVFVELKTTNKKPTPVQLAVHRKLKGLGFRVEIIDNSNSIMTLLKEYETN